MTVDGDPYELESGQFKDWPGVGRVCRLGLATRGNTSLDPEDVEHAVDRGINYLNWCRHADGLQEWIRQSGRRREDVRVAVQGVVVEIHLGIQGHDIAGPGDHHGVDLHLGGVQFHKGLVLRV